MCQYGGFDVYFWRNSRFEFEIFGCIGKFLCSNMYSIVDKCLPQILEDIKTKGFDLGFIRIFLCCLIAQQRTLKKQTFKHRLRMRLLGTNNKFKIRTAVTAIRISKQFSSKGENSYHVVRESNGSVSKSFICVRFFIDYISLASFCKKVLSSKLKSTHCKPFK